MEVQKHLTHFGFELNLPRSPMPLLHVDALRPVAVDLGQSIHRRVSTGVTG
jgi:hypothetical protein